MSNQLNITPETVAAVNAVIDKYGSSLHGGELDEFGVSALILALAACEPVAGLVEAASDVLSDVWFVEDRGQYPVSKFKLKAVEAALAPFAKGGA